MPNQGPNGWAREAYFLWYGLTFDYSRLRTWGSRTYAINHITAKDYGPRSETGIFVGLKPGVQVTIDYEIYLPHKNTFVTTGDAIFCEHVGRSEPERLLPPIMEADLGKPLNPENYQQLVDTVHYDEQEGVNYRVLKVYKSKGLVIVDRELYDPPNLKRRVIDTIHLGDALNMPIMAGTRNPKYTPSSSIRNADVATGKPDQEKQAVPIVKTAATIEELRLEAETSRPDELRSNATSGDSTRQSKRIRGRSVEETSALEVNLIDTWIEGSTNWMAELS
jgi:hypothetical protein